MPNPTVLPEHGIFLTLGVPHGQAGKDQIVRACELLQNEGFLVGITSDEAVLAMAEQISHKRGAEVD